MTILFILLILIILLLFLLLLLRIKLYYLSICFNYVIYMKLMLLIYTQWTNIIE